MSKKKGEIAKTKQARESFWSKYSTVELILELFATLLFVFVAIYVSQLVVGLIMIAILGREGFEQPIPTAIFSVLYYAIALIMVVFLSPKLVNLIKKWYKKKRNPKSRWAKVKSKPMSRKEIGLEGLPTWLDIGLALLGFVAYLILAGILTFVFSQFDWFNVEEAQEIGFEFGIVGVDRIVAYVVLVVIAPIVEEILFRGWLYEKLRVRLSRETTVVAASVVSAILVSLLFGFVHGQWNVGVNVFAMSLVLCAMREITGTIYSGILLHMIKNGIAFYFLFVAGMY